MFCKPIFPNVNEVPLVVDANQDLAFHPALLTLKVFHVKLDNECVLYRVVPANDTVALNQIQV